MKVPAWTHISLIAVNTIYAFNYLAVKEIVPSEIGAFGLVTYRILFGMLIFTTFHLLIGREKLKRKDFLYLIGCAVFGIMINQLLFIKGISLTKPINASLIMIMVPIFVMFISYLFLKEKIGWKKSIGIILGALGAAILITKLQPIDVGSETLKGDLHIVSNAMAFAIYLVMVRKLMKTYKPLTVTRWLFTFGFFLVFPIGFGELKQIDWSAFTPIKFGAFFYILVFPTVVANFLYVIALKKARATLVSSYIYLQPLLTALFAIYYGKDELDIYKVVGGSLIFLGLTLVNFSGTSKKIAIQEDS